jgi:hypothetical protein
LIGNDKLPNPRFGERWSDQEEAQVVQAIQTYPIAQIAQSIGRSPKAIIMHLEEMAVRALDKGCSKEQICGGYRLPSILVEACEARKQLLTTSAPPSGIAIEE